MTTIMVDVEVDVEEVLSGIDDEDLLEELNSREAPTTWSDLAREWQMFGEAAVLKMLRGMLTERCLLVPRRKAA